MAEHASPQQTIEEYIAASKARAVAGRRGMKETPSLEAIRENLLEVRNHVHFNIGSPEAIDHLLVSIVCVIDALLAIHTPSTGEET